MKGPFSPALDRLPPQALDAEQGALGCMLVSGEAVDVVRSILKPGDWYRLGNRRIYEAVLKIDDRREPVDGLTVAQELDRMGAMDTAGGRVYLSACAASVAAPSHAESYAHAVLHASTLRALIELGGEVVGDAYQPAADPAAVMERACARLFRIQSRAMNSGPATMQDVIREVHAEIVRMAETGEGTRGLSTGLKALDAITGGLKDGELTIIAGRPSMGKSSACLTFVNAVAASGKGALVFSPEMSRKGLGYRLLSQEAKIDSRRLEVGALYSDSHHGDEHARLQDSAARLMALPVWIDDRTDRQIGEVRAIARRWKQQHDIALVAVDYAQLMARSATTEDEMRHEVARISAGMKAVATELGVAAVLLSQVTRRCEQRGDKRPILSDLAESGDLEADADVVLFPFRPAYYERDLAGGPREEAEIRVAKNRNGPLGSASLEFIHPFSYFADLDAVPEEPERGGRDEDRWR